MKTLLLTCAQAVALVGCASTDDEPYQFGDVTQGGLDAFRTQQANYCTTTSPVLRAALLTAIRSQVPGYPASGLCTDADQALADKIARRMADLPEGATVSLEQARRDQQRFEEQRDESRDPEAAAESATDPAGSQDP